MVKSWLVVAAVAGSLLIAGCGKAPQEEMQMAQTVLAPDRIQDLEPYAPDAFQLARDTLNAALAAAKEQDSKFALFRRYGNSKAMFVSAKNLADAAVQQAESEKERIHTETEEMLVTAQAAVDSVTALFQSAPKGKDTKAELLLIKNEIDALPPALEQARTDMANGQYMDAKAKTEAVLEKARSVSTELSTAISRKTRS